MMKTILNKVADLWVGAVIKRYTSESETDHFYKVLTLKSIDADGWLDIEQLDQMYMIKPMNEKYLTKVGDVIIRLSAPHTALVINTEQTGLVITSAFARITNIAETIVPDYLAFALNSENYRTQYLKQTISMAATLVQVGTLRNLSLAVPEIVTQKYIAQLNRLWTEERQLEREIALAKEEKRLNIQKTLLERYR